MNRQIQARASAYPKNAHIIEHTPIYDLAAYQQRQRKNKRHQILKNAAETSMYFCAAALTFSMLFWGV